MYLTCRTCKNEVCARRLFIAASDNLLQSVEYVEVDELRDAYALQRRSHPLVQPQPETASVDDIYSFVLL